MADRLTLLAALAADTGPGDAADRIADRLARGDLTLAGNFRGRERSMARQYRAREKRPRGK